MKDRIYKFRAWDEQKKIMHNTFQFISSGDEGNDWIVFVSEHNKFSDNKEDKIILDNPHFRQQLKIMQFTGKQDKNGNDIYEGDILKYYDCLDIKDRIQKGIVVKWFNESSSFSGLSNTSVKVIIGNIYTNPELNMVQNNG